MAVTVCKSSPRPSSSGGRLPPAQRSCVPQTRNPPTHSPVTLPLSAETRHSDDTERHRGQGRQQLVARHPRSGPVTRLSWSSRPTASPPHRRLHEYSRARLEADDGDLRLAVHDLPHGLSGGRQAASTGGAPAHLLPLAQHHDRGIVLVTSPACRARRGTLAGDGFESLESAAEAHRGAPSARTASSRSSRSTKSASTGRPRVRSSSSFVAAMSPPLASPTAGSRSSSSATSS